MKNYHSVIFEKRKTFRRQFYFDAGIRFNDTGEKKTHESLFNVD